MKLLIDIPEHIYEHAKETTEDSRDEFDAMRAIANGTQQESRSENPNTCGDAISRQAAIEEIRFGQSFITKIHPTGEIEHLFDKENKALEAAVERIEALSSVTPQQRTGRWIAQDIHNCHTAFKCSECGYIYNFMHVYGKPTADYTYCPHCGAKMESEDKDSK